MKRSKMPLLWKLPDGLPILFPDHYATLTAPPCPTVPHRAPGTGVATVPPVPLPPKGGTGTPHGTPAHPKTNPFGGTL